MSREHKGDIRDVPMVQAQPDDGDAIDILRLLALLPRAYYGYVRQLEVETFRRQVVRTHIELWCIRKMLFDALGDPPYPDISDRARAWGMLNATLTVNALELQTINGALPMSLLGVTRGDRRRFFVLQPAHLHEGAWIEIWFNNLSGPPAMVRLPQGTDPAEIDVDPIEQVRLVAAIGRVRPISTLRHLRILSDRE